MLSFVAGRQLRQMHHYHFVLMVLSRKSNELILFFFVQNCLRWLVIVKVMMTDNYSSKKKNQKRYTNVTLFKISPYIYPISLSSLGKNCSGAIQASIDLDSDFDLVVRFVSAGYLWAFFVSGKVTWAASVGG